MKKEILLKVVICIGCAGMLLGLNYVLFQICMIKKLDLVTTYIASQDIAPRTQIKEDDIVEVQIAREYLLDNTCINKEEIIGKYTEIQGMIPAGSVFYKHMLHAPDTLPDHAQLQLKEGETSYGVRVDVASLGSIIAGQRVDIHVEIDRRDSVPLTGALIANARVICVKDHQGIQLSDVSSTGVPYLMELAIQREDLDLLTLAESTGSLRFFASEQAYSTELEASLINDSEITQYLKGLKAQG